MLIIIYIHSCPEAETKLDATGSVYLFVWNEFDNQLPNNSATNCQKIFLKLTCQHFAWLVTLKWLDSMVGQSWSKIIAENKF